MTDPNKHLMDTLRGSSGHGLDTIGNSLARLVARAEAFRDAGDHDSQQWTLAVLGEKLAEVSAINAAFQAASTRDGEG